ncbi:MAG TPA: type II toxin-antitoxin system VapC family toxin [Solirubrobacterales bacterium]|nr:type II toxin-antitoxin system VapC family toxin [Solirubrobacterales bacterium]
MTVVDASVIVTALIRGEYAEWAEEQLSAAGAGRSLWAPHLIDAEVGHALRRRVAARKLGDDRASAALGKLVGLPLRRIAHTDLLNRAWELRHNLSIYDGLYVALAETLRMPLLTLDRRLAKAARASTGIEVLTDRQRGA